MSNFTFLKTEDGMRDIMLHNPDRFGPMSIGAENIMRGPSELSIAERELIFAYVSGCNSCDFCFGAHKAVAHAFGIREGLLDELLGADIPSAAGNKILPCLLLARKASCVGGGSNQIGKTDIDAIIDVGWQEATAHDVLCIAALANFSNTLVSGHGVIGSEAYFNETAESLGPSGGYAPA